MCAWKTIALAKEYWKRWGPYLSERQWGTVREDYSPGGTAWEFFPHDHARSRAYRWGEDGIAGISDRHQMICFALALWNGRDPILKERLFGLTGNEGNHGEDVKEYYFYLDSTPTHSYMQMLYKYPQAEFPYQALVDENRRRGRSEPEFELYDTGVFARESLLRCFCGIRQRQRRGYFYPHYRMESRAGSSHAASVADAVVSQYLVVGQGLAAADDPQGDSAWTESCAANCSTGSTESAGCLPQASRNCFSPKTKPTTHGCSTAAIARLM